MKKFKFSKLKVSVNIGFLISFSIFLIAALMITVDGLNDEINASDIAIIYGSKVYPNGMLSNRLKARLDKGIELYHQGFFKYIIVSGGVGKEGVDEALAMKNYLLAHHLPAESISVDSHGNNTNLTAKNSAGLMQTKGLKSAMIISQFFHISRARLALRHYGIFLIYSAHANYFEWRDLYSLFREVIGYSKYLIFMPLKHDKML